jgi:hypothetical protein
LRHRVPAARVRVSLLFSCYPSLRGGCQVSVSQDRRAKTRKSPTLCLFWQARKPFVSTLSENTVWLHTVLRGTLMTTSLRLFPAAANLFCLRDPLGREYTPPLALLSTLPPLASLKQLADTAPGTVLSYNAAVTMPRMPGGSGAARDSYNTSSSLSSSSTSVYPSSCASISPPRSSE